MKRIGIIVAMSSEFELVETQMTDKKQVDVHGVSFTEGMIADKQIVLHKCGMGKVCSAVGVVEMIHQYDVDVIINTGVAGGIDSGLHIMDVVVGRETVYHDSWCGEGFELGQIQGFPKMFKGDETLYNAAMSIQSDVTIVGGLICSGDRFITSKEELGVIKGNFPEGLAVDMESNSMAQVCYQYHVPFISLRVISDTPGVEDHLNQYTNFWEEAPKTTFKVLKQLIELI